MAKKDSKETKNVPVTVETPVEIPETLVEKKVEIPEPPIPVLLSSGKWTFGPTTTITCQDCGKERVIKIQDSFQVTRCVECQKKRQNRIRNEKRKAANKAKRDAQKLAEAYRLVAEAEKKAQANSQE